MGHVEKYKHTSPENAELWFSWGGKKRFKEQLCLMTQEKDHKPKHADQMNLAWRAPVSSAP